MWKFPLLFFHTFYLLPFFFRLLYHLFQRKIFLTKKERVCAQVFQRSSEMIRSIIDTTTKGECSDHACMGIAEPSGWDSEGVPIENDRASRNSAES